MSRLRTYAPFIIPMILFLGVMSFIGHVGLGVSTVHAQVGSTTGSGVVSTTTGSTITNPLKFNSITCLVLAIIDVVLIFLIPVIVLYIMYAGFLFVKSQGNPGGLAEAKKALIAGLIGGVIVLGARTILSVVEGTISAVTDTDSSIFDSGNRSCSSS